MQTALDVAGLVPGFGEFADGANALIYLARGDYGNASLSTAAMIPFVGWGATGAKIGRKIAKAADAIMPFTKSNLKIGREMHDAYKLGENGVKEFRLPSGKRIDFLDINNGVIFELKPNNPRQIRQGERQLQQYLNEIQSPQTLEKYPELKGINWRTMLDTY